MANELHTLIRLSQWQLDEKRKAMAVLLAKVEAVETEKARVLAELEAESKKPPEAFEGGLTQGPFIKASYQKRDQMDELLKALAAEVEAAQTEIQTAFEELKRYEIAAEQRALKAKKEAARRETKALDEAGSTQQQSRRTDKD
jgi:flagellar FliJ protein